MKKTAVDLLFFLFLFSGCSTKHAGFAGLGLLGPAGAAVGVTALIVSKASDACKDYPVPEGFQQVPEIGNGKTEKVWDNGKNTVVFLACGTSDEDAKERLGKTIKQWSEKFPGKEIVKKVDIKDDPTFPTDWIKWVREGSLAGETDTYKTKK